MSACFIDFIVKIGKSIENTRSIEKKKKLRKEKSESAKKKEGKKKNRKSYFQISVVQIYVMYMKHLF